MATMQRSINSFLLAGLASVSLGAVTARADYASDYPDFACEVDEGPIANPGSITVDSLRTMSEQANGQEQIDRIYAQLTSGPMPSGFYNGNIIFAKSEMSTIINRFAAALGMPALDTNFVKTFGETLWHGKVFKADPLAREGVPTAILANKMPVTDSLTVQMIIGQLLRTMRHPNAETITSSLEGTNQWRFPAKVFCGQSLLDSRRESIIIDYAHSEKVEDADTDPAAQIRYAKAIDEIADRDHLQIRDEIRMVRPGFYLGRAYLGRVFILNFTLECREGACQQAPQTGDACMVGTQRLANTSGQRCLPMAQFRN